MTQSDVAQAARLVARSTPIDEPTDLLDHHTPGDFVWIDGAHGFVAAGVAARVAPDEAVQFLASVVHSTAPGTPAGAGPRAVGALPFVGTDDLVVPSRIVARDADGRAWQTTIDDRASTPLHIAPVTPSEFRVVSLTSVREWRALVERALELIHDGPLEKVVLARAVTVVADAPFDVRTVLGHLRRLQPDCIVYGYGGFVGASPELLVRKRGPDVACRPLAGTAATADELLHSRKDAREHQMVVDAVIDALTDRCADLHVAGPVPLTLANVAHLATIVTGRIDTDSANVIDLVAALHPTPAVAGTPRAAALTAIHELEAVPRGRYAGPCGWVDRDGDGEFVIALRGGELDGNRALLHAGAGIVDGSDPDDEWAETQAKLTPMLQALVRP